MQWNRRQRRTLVNGRLVEDASKGYGHFSWLRAAVMTFAVSVLLFSNPANDLKGLQKYTNTNSNLLDFVPRSWWDEVVRSIELSLSFSRNYWSLDWRVNARHTTNFGLFCITKQQDVQVTVYAAGFKWHCRYDDPSLVLAGYSLCRDVLGDHMTHQRPVLYDESDYVYTTHRITSWLLVGAALLSACYTAPIMIATGNSLLDSSVCFFFDTNKEALPDRGPLWSLGMKLVNLNVFIYPALLVMNETVQLQHQRSLFATFDSAEYNFALSLAILFGIALLVSVASKSWSMSPSRFLRQFDAVTAVVMGYYTAYRVETTPHNNDTWNILTWTCFLLFVTNGSIMGAIFWSMAHCAGHVLFLYQFEHVSTVRTLVSWLDSASKMLDEVAAYMLRPPQRRPVH